MRSTPCLIPTLLFPVIVKSLYEPTDLRGDVWPIPNSVSIDRSEVFKINKNLNFVNDFTGDCAVILNDNIQRYTHLVKQPNFQYSGNIVKPGEELGADTVGMIDSVSFRLNGGVGDCEGGYPQHDSEESYQLKIVENVISIEAAEIWGLLNGLETLSQLIWWQDVDNSYIFRVTIEDEPRFSFRGYMLDTANHFITKQAIFQLLDGMNYNKLNVFHWHIVDDMSFPYESKLFPNLHKLGAYPPFQTHHYSTEDMTEIIEYARFRGIRVLPEFDTPGHVDKMCSGLGNGFCVDCLHTADGDEIFKFGPIDPSEEANYDIMRSLWKELRGLFKDDYLHLGGDEVKFRCWAENERVMNWAGELGLRSASEIQSYYMDRLYEITREEGFKYLVWNEIFDGTNPDSVPDSNKPIVQIWEPWKAVTDGWKPIMKNATSQGYQTILSTSWYLDLISYPYSDDRKYADWANYYEVNPTDFDGTVEEKARVLGGEGTYWSEYIDSTGIVPGTFPRQSAIAEKLWSSESKTESFLAALPRIIKHSCLLNLRGVAAYAVATPSECWQEWQVGYKPPY